MIRFHQSFGAHAGRTVELDRDVIRFGRMPDCEVAFDAQADLDASGRHAEVRREGGDWVVVDLGSRNGTWVNGERVQRRALRSGDEIEFGHGGPRVRVELPSGAAAGASTPPAVGVSDTPARVDAATGPSSPAVSEGEAPTLAASATPLPPPPASSPPSGRAPPPGGIPTPRGHSTDFIRAVAQDVAEQTTSRSTLWLKIGLGCVSAALVLALGAVAVLFLALREQQQTPAIGDGGLVQPARQASGADLSPEELGRAHGPGVFVLEGVGEQAEAVCTGFAVRPRMLATTSQCVLELQRRRGEGQQTRAVSLAGGEPVAIERMWRHPGFDADEVHPEVDAGLVQLASAAEVTLELASLRRLARLQAGESLLLHAPGSSGAPGRVRSVPLVQVKPAGGDEGGGPALLQLEQPAAAVARGAPLLDRAGAVVGLYVGPQDAGPPLAVRCEVVIALLAGLDDPPG